LNKITGSLRKIDFWHPRPIVWNIAMLAYFVDTIVSAFPFSLNYPASLYASLVFLLGIPLGSLYSLGELVKVDRQTLFLVRVQKIMIACMITFVIFGFVLLSLNNMIAAISGQYPFDPILYPGGRFVLHAAGLVFGIGAVLIRRNLPSPVSMTQEEPTTPRTGRRSPAWFLQVAGILLAGSGLYLGLFRVIALEGLILLMTGLILYPVGSLLRRITKHKSPNPTQPC
jgi:hypothetical protein